MRCLVDFCVTFSNSFGFTRSNGFQSFKVICDISSAFFINCLLRDNDFFGGESVFVGTLSPSGIPKCGRFFCLFNERPCAAYGTFHLLPTLDPLPVGLVTPQSVAWFLTERCKEFIAKRLRSFLSRFLALFISLSTFV